MLIYAGRMLADESTLASYSIRRWPILHMVTHPIPKIKVTVETPTNEMITLQVDLWNTIQNIKAMIAGPVAVGPNRQKLMYSGKQLEDHKILADYNIKSGTTLCVVYSPIQIFIKMWSGKTVAIEVDPSDAVHEVMAKILNKERTPIEHHSLVFGGKRLDEERTLASYNIRKESTLHLVTAVSSRIKNRIRVWLMNREMIVLAVEGSDTIACVKEKIHLATGIPANAQTLKIDPIVKEELENDRTVSDYKIRMGSTLYLYC
ncbi:uncharacterized protein LOC131217223 [Magnolia sinica]|uniref:uncharacterized protein LOC131217223 n=1 Tax=Magnolia sinica TaxID=86752 RepID=UPI002658BBEB|nr:uncharacterized protein LOC131217223 [Magnolia sinica]XP_058068057.1 uncharacterized protein LOC131217223 [Magnolia sinica]XP_058068058.1 uncharacterized protein LOC131217223 [Magnolia sinica]XP_058068059.1 uncharacterized protein LOC131217223 [Magnolia sinica]